MVKEMDIHDWTLDVFDELKNDGFNKWHDEILVDLQEFIRIAERKPDEIKVIKGVGELANRYFVHCFNLVWRNGEKFLTVDYNWYYGFEIKRYKNNSYMSNVGVVKKPLELDIKAFFHWVSLDILTLPGEKK